MFQLKKSITSFLVLTTVFYLTGCGAGKKETSETDSTSSGRTFVFGDERAFAQCHASTLVRLDDGQFLVAWFGGTEERNPDVGIWLTRGNEGHWSEPVEIAKVREDAHWNPVLQKGPDGTIYLYFKVGKEIAQWETWVKTSKDGGKTWSEAYELMKGDRGGRGPVKNKLLQLADGTWLAGSSNEVGRWEVFVDRSEDSGKTWKASRFFKVDTMQIKGKGAIQPTLWESAPGKIHMLVRTTGGVVGRSDSEDNGKTWSTIYATALPNPNSGIDLAKLDDGTLALAYNPDGRNWGSRYPLMLALSYDDGKNWTDKFNLEVGGKDDEFSYPAVISWGDSVAVTYTWNRQKVAFWKGSKADIVKKASEEKK